MSLHDPQLQLTIDRQFELIRRRDRLIGKLWSLALTLFAIVIVLAVMLLAATVAHASADCMTKAQARAAFPHSHLWWHGPTRCWDANSGRRVHYKGHKVAPDVLPVHAEVKQINLDANGNDPTPFDEIMEQPQPTEICCWPPVDERSFKSRWEEVPVKWLSEQ